MNTVPIFWRLVLILLFIYGGIEYFIMGNTKEALISGAVFVMIFLGERGKVNTDKPKEVKLPNLDDRSKL